MEKQQYWQPLHTAVTGVQLEMRAGFAWDLLGRFGIIAGQVKFEDSAGRAVLDVMPVPETVARCFALADLFVDTAEARGELRASTEDDVAAAFVRGGELERLKSEATWPPQTPAPSVRWSVPSAG